MRFRINKSWIIKSENAAKPIAQESNFVKQMIREMEPVDAILNFGCGKLRYLNEMQETSKHLVLVDSEIQLSRTQTLLGKKTSIRELFADSNSVKVMNSKELIQSSFRFDRAFCLNILSVVPIIPVRQAMIRRIYSNLRDKGVAIFSTQYRNSGFARMQLKENCHTYQDGFVMDSLRGYSFYGLIDRASLVKMLTKEGFFIYKTRLHEGSAYVFAGKNKLNEGEAF